MVSTSGDQDEETIDNFLHVSLCESSLHQEIGRPWARLAVLVAIGLATDDQARELHLARGGRIVMGKDGKEIWVVGGDPLPP